MRLTYLTILILTGLYLIGCNQRITGSSGDRDTTDSQSLVNKIGSDQTFEIATWNIENYPQAGETTVSLVKTIIKDLDVDMLGVEEIASVSSFNRMLDDMPGWKGVLSEDVYSSGSYQKTGIIYKSSFISVRQVKNIFTDDGYAFPRPPLAAYVEVKDLQGVKFDFNLIVLHLKAKSGESNEARRRSACEKLKDYIDQEIQSGADPDFIVLGDWNDQLNDPDSLNVFKVFLDDTADYTFLTAGLRNQYSYISNAYKSLIDNILITADVRTEYDRGQTQVLYLDDSIKNFSKTVSDHRPVAAIFKGISLQLPVQ